MIKPYDPRFMECTITHGFGEARARVAPDDPATAWRFCVPTIQACYIPRQLLTDAERAMCGAYVPVRVNGVVGYLRKASIAAWSPLCLQAAPEVRARLHGDWLRSVA
jgi:hypothetical protein